MAKYSKGSSEKVREAMEELKAGKLKSSSGQKVTSRKQAIAIGLSKARDAGEKVPVKGRAARKRSAKKNSTGKTAAKKSAAKKASSKR